jgi:hypothetical protein
MMGIVGQVGNLPPIVNRRVAGWGKSSECSIGRFSIGGRLPTCPTKQWEEYAL